MILEKSMVLLGLWIKHPLVFNHQGVCQFPTNMNNTTEYTMVLNKFNQRLVILNFGLTVINSYMITVDLSSSRLNPSKRWVSVSSLAYSGGQQRLLINYHSPYQHTETTVAVSYNFLWPSYLCVIANDSEHVNVRTVIAKYPQH